MISGWIISVLEDLRTDFCYEVYGHARPPFCYNYACMLRSILKRLCDVFLSVIDRKICLDETGMGKGCDSGPSGSEGKYFSWC